MSDGATHHCIYCGARWRQNKDRTWSLVSAKCGACCDNALMGHQIVSLPENP